LRCAGGSALPRPLHRATVDGEQAREAFHQGGFAGTVWANDAEDFMLVDSEANVSQRGSLAEMLRERGDFQQRVAGRAAGTALVVER
jgi:hypothetical protein